MALYLHLLDGVWLEHKGERHDFPGIKASMLLYYLACQDSWVGRSALADVFRPEADEATARHYLRLMLANLKNWPFFETLEIEKTRLRWQVQADVKDFKLALGKNDFTRALALYQKPLLTGHVETDLSGFESWLELERANLHESFRRAALVQAKQVAPALAEPLLAKLLADDLLAEDILQAYLETCQQLGERARGLAAYASFKEKLEQELDLKPLEETQALATALRETSSSTKRKPVQNTLPQPLLQLPELVGREIVIRQLLESPQAIGLISGEPGIGKTSLLKTIAPRAVYLRFPEGLSSVPYFPLVEHLRQNLNTLPDLSGYQESLARFVPELMPKHSFMPFDPVLGKTLLLAAWARYLESFSVADGYNLIFDDVQWADSSSLELMLYLAQQKRLGFLLAYRSTEVSSELQRVLDVLQAQAFQVNLAPLSVEALKELLAQLSQSAKGPEQFSQWLFKKTGGNPFFALETLKGFFEAGVLQNSREGWQSTLDKLSVDYHELEIPRAVSEVIYRRVRGLSEASQRVLPIAALLQEGFSAEELSKLSGLSTLAVLDVLEEAQTRNLIKGAQFQHDLVQQSLYDSLNPERKRFLHLQAAQLLEGSEPSIIAEHFARAQVFDKAAQYWLKAARKLNKQDLTAQAIPYLEARLDLAPPPWHARLQAQLASDYVHLGRYQDAEALAQAVQKSTDPRASAYAAHVLCHLRFGEGKLEQAQSYLQEAKNKGYAEAAFETSLCETQALLWHAEGKFQEALNLLQPLLPKHKPDTSDLSIMTSAASLLDNLNRSEEALDLHRQVWDIVADTGSCFYKCNTASNLLACYIDLQRPEEGIPIAEEALAACRDYPHDGMLFLQNNLAAAYMRLGNHARAQQLYEAITAGEIKQPAQCVALAGLAKLYALSKKMTAAHKTLERALNALEHHEHPVSRASVCAKALAYGNNPQQQRAMKLLKDLELDKLPPDIQVELKLLLPPN